MQAPQWRHEISPDQCSRKRIFRQSNYLIRSKLGTQSKCCEPTQPRHTKRINDLLNARCTSYQFMLPNIRAKQTLNLLQKHHVVFCLVDKASQKTNVSTCTFWSSSTTNQCISPSHKKTYAYINKCNRMNPGKYEWIPVCERYETYQVCLCGARIYQPGILGNHTAWWIDSHFKAANVCCTCEFVHYPCLPNTHLMLVNATLNQEGECSEFNKNISLRGPQALLNAMHDVHTIFMNFALPCPRDH